MRPALSIGGVFLLLLGASRPDAGVRSDFDFTTYTSGGWKVDCSKSRATCIVHVDGGQPYKCPGGATCALFPGARAPSECPEAELRKDPDAAVRFVDLDGLHRSYLEFGGCPKKVYVDLAESYADRIPKVLVDHWSELEGLDIQCRKDPKFRRFVLGFIDGSGDSTALAHLATLSASCEGKAKGLCQDIHRQAVEALEESAAALDGGAR